MFSHLSTVPVVWDQHLDHSHRGAAAATLLCLLLPLLEVIISFKGFLLVFSLPRRKCLVMAFQFLCFVVLWVITYFLNTELLLALLNQLVFHIANDPLKIKAPKTF